MDHAVVIDNLTKRFKRRSGALVPAIDGVDLEIERGEFVVLLGPSGCGKTTLLRSIAGLEVPDTGRIEVQGQTVFSDRDGVSMSPERRPLSMMFQSYALWPHMTVQQNVRYPLENRRTDRLKKKAMNAKVAQILSTVGIADLEHSYPGQLSGGQQQRVALARALVNDSDVILFDEPLSNVDAKVREQLRIELLGTQRRLGFTAIFVTHDQSEAMELATRIATLDHGKVQQFASPAEIYRSPRTEYVAKFVGRTNEMRGRLTEPGRYETALGELVVQTDSAPLDANILWRPESGHLSAERPAGTNAFQGRVAAMLFMGTHTEYLVKSGEHRLRIWTSQHESFASGDDVWVSVGARDLMVFPAGSDARPADGDTA